MSLVNIHLILCCLEIKSGELIHIFNSNITRKCKCNIVKTYIYFVLPKVITFIIQAHLKVAWGLFLWGKIGLSLCVVGVNPAQHHCHPDYRRLLLPVLTPQTFQLLHATNHPPGPSYLLQISPDTDSKHGWGGRNYWAFIHPTEWFSKHPLY